MAAGSKLVVADFDGDGTPDPAVATHGTYPDYKATVSILLGNGDGAFEVGQTYAAGPYASSVAVADFDRDGSLDLAVGNDSGVRILLGNGAGTFQAAQSYAAGGDPISLVVGDFNGNEYPDLAVADYSSNTVSIPCVGIASRLASSFIGGHARERCRSKPRADVAPSTSRGR